MSAALNKFNLTPPRNVLVVCTQRIGDVLLSTPIARSIKAKWPEVNIDYLVLPGTEGVLEGNPDIRAIFAFPQRAKWHEKLSQIRRIWRRYDLAIAAVPTDRARLFAWAAAPQAVGFTTPDEAGWLKRHLLKATIPFDNLHTHTVAMSLKLLAPLGIQASHGVQPPRCAGPAWAKHKQNLGIGNDAYAVIHPSPKFRYKMWDQRKWAELIGWLQRHPLKVFLTGSNDPDEIAYINAIVEAAPGSCRSLAGQLTLAQTTELLRGASLYIGPDTAVTHLAAATGTPSIALFGPSNPVKWGPWPTGWESLQSPWKTQGSGRQGNVWLIQGEGDCVPCLLEGCDRHLDSESRCLMGVSVERVSAAAEKMLVSELKRSN